MLGGAQCSYAFRLTFDNLGFFEQVCSSFNIYEGRLIDYDVGCIKLLILDGF